MFNKKDKFSIGTYKWYYQWNLIWWKIEGNDCLNGLNVYPPSDEHSSGFVIKIGRFKARVRYSKRTKKLHMGAVWIK